MLRRATEALLALALTAAPSRASAQPSRRGFVRVDGRHFVVDGARFRFLGANAAVMHGGVHRADLDEVFGAMVADGLTVARVWALGERPAASESWGRDYAFRLGPDGWVSTSFDHLDQVIEAAGRRGLRLVVVLANRWADYGGVPQYLQWLGHDLARQRALGEHASLAVFFDDAEARAQYLAHVARVVTRINARTGVAYRDDPTVMAWELINEVDCAPRDRPLLLRWTQEIARAIHAMDPSHLVAAGHIGYSRQSQRETWLATQSLPEVDYADAHAYPTTSHAVQTLGDLDDFVDDHAALARNVANKPMVWGEFGFTTRDAQHLGQPRARWYERFLERAALDGAAGAMVWLYATSRDPPGEHAIVVDEPATRRVDDLRAVLRAHASRWRGEGSTENPRLLVNAPEPLWRTDREREGPGAAPVVGSTRAGALRWSLRPESFARLRAEASGRWDGFAVMHLWASGAAFVDYRLRTPAGAPASLRRLVLRARVSSELPGRGEGSEAGDVSDVAVTIDGLPVGRFVAPRDDGAGRWVEVRTEDPTTAAALRRPGVHTLRFQVVHGARANGLCLYGHATGREAPPADGGPLPGRIQLSLVQ